MDERTGNIRVYEEILMYTVQHIESEYKYTFAQVFDSHLQPLTALNPGVGGGQKHNPLDYPEFVQAVHANEQGTLVYTYETAQAGKREIYMCFRWVPTDTSCETRYLIAVGVSRFTVNESIDRTVIYGAIAFIIVMAIFMSMAVVYVCRVGYIWEERKEGEKWRGKEM